MAEGELSTSLTTDDLFRNEYGALRKLAQSLKNRMAFSDETRSATELVNELYVKIAKKPVSFDSHEAAIAWVSAAIKNLMRDYVRHKHAMKRDVGRKMSFSACLRNCDDAAFISSDPADGLAVFEALDALKKANHRAYLVMELRLFGGLTITEVAEELAVSRRTVQSDWTMALNYVFNLLEGET